MRIHSLHFKSLYVIFLTMLSFRYSSNEWCYYLLRVRGWERNISISWKLSPASCNQQGRCISHFLRSWYFYVIFLYTWANGLLSNLTVHLLRYSFFPHLFTERWEKGGKEKESWRKANWRCYFLIVQFLNKATSENNTSLKPI